MASINELRARIECETGYPVPAMDPNGPRENAEVMFVLRDPGMNGAKRTMVVSPFYVGYDGTINLDDTARLQRDWFADSPLDPGRCVWWNLVPWNLPPSPKRPDKDRAPTPREYRDGAAYLPAALTALPKLSYVVLACAEARKLTLPTKYRPVPLAHPTDHTKYGRNRPEKWREALAKMHRGLPPRTPTLS